MMKKYLLAPGPTPVPNEALLAMFDPTIHHRMPDFEKVLAEVRDGLKFLFQCKNEVLIFSASGTGAMEGAVTNTLCKGDKAIVVRGGKFGERWTDICTAYGVQPINIDVKWGEAVDPQVVEDTLKANPDVKAVMIQASETSTGAMHPTKEIADLVRPRENTILIVDGITGVGVFDLPVDKWGIDVLVGGSQKALMLPPGLAFAAMTDKAWKFTEKSDLPKFYFNFKKEQKNLVKNQTAYTPAVTLILGLRETLKHIRAEGLENLFARHDRLARATRAGVQAMGLTLYAPKNPSTAVTAVNAPEGIEGGKIVKGLRDKHGITIAGGQDQAKGKIFRIAHLGYFDKFDIIMVLAAVELVLNELGYKVEFGKGVRAAEEIFSKQS
jgi:aspartate aminotransferase-like enzyme